MEWLSTSLIAAYTWTESSPTFIQVTIGMCLAFSIRAILSAAFVRPSNEAIAITLVSSLARGMDEIHSQLVKANERLDGSQERIGNDLRYLIEIVHDFKFSVSSHLSPAIDPFDDR